MESKYRWIIRCSDATLQWGHNILVVESRISEGRSQHVAGLQWGHNILVVERKQTPPIWNHRYRCFNGATTYSLWKGYALDVALGCVHNASMGPQHTRCGKQRPHRPVRAGGNASMGPQHTRCGKACSHSRSYMCGQCFNGATTYSLWKANLMSYLPGRWTKLQWGHNILVVESGPRSQRHRRGTKASMGPQHTRCGKQIHALISCLAS